MYRAVALFAKTNGITFSDLAALERMLVGIKLEFKIKNNISHIYLNGNDVSEAIREPEISILSSSIATIKIVRQKMVEIQRLMAESNQVILDGRDIGTVVFPHSKHKFFLIADLDTRTQRRLKELQEKGVDADFEKVKKDLVWRDTNDSNRAESPLKKADDAMEIDTTILTVDETVNKMLRMINKAIE
jgi:cytidylate kinase